MAEASTAEDRALMRQLVEQRDRLSRELGSLDRLAAERVVAGEEPLDLYARQIEVELQLESVVTRLEALSARSGVVIPPVGEGDELREAQRAETLERGRALLERGRERAVVVVADETRVFLASLDFEEFLADD
ncbi:hypothetical protein [Mucisphaera sp.]|uniref:hypothetical protein n=1 Tax=Mucisphaera sp. TaxID=2913024 RepID=UPI003D11F791